MRSLRINSKLAMMIGALLLLTIALSRLRADTGTCGGVSVTLPFNDVMGNTFFCQIAEAYFSGLTNGTSATAYSPANNVTREQMAAFTTRTLDQSLRRGSRRGALNQWAIPTSVSLTGKTTVDGNPYLIACDGADLWVANIDGSVSRVRASDGKLLETWTEAFQAYGVVVARGRVFVTKAGSPGRLYVIDPKQPAGQVTTLADDLGDSDGTGIAFAGYYIWTANNNSVSRVDPGTGAVTNYTTGFSNPEGMVYDGSNIWVTDSGDDTIKKLNSLGSVVRTIAVGDFPFHPIFDGMNIWVPNYEADSITVVRVKDAGGNPLTNPFVLATLTGNGLEEPVSAAFDGERILVTNFTGDSVSLWKAADLTPLGFAAGAPSARGACSDGLNFWIALGGNPGKLARF